MKLPKNRVYFGKVIQFCSVGNVALNFENMTCDMQFNTI